MPPTRVAALDIQADLALTVTAPDGRSTTARAVGEGNGIRVTTARPDVLLAAVDRADIGPLADLLDAVGMSVYVDGPGGQVAVIGSAASSRVGRLLTGSTNAAVRPAGAIPSAVLPVVAAVIVTITAVAVGIVRAGRR